MDDWLAPRPPSINCTKMVPAGSITLTRLWDYCQGTATMLRLVGLRPSFERGIATGIAGLISLSRTRMFPRTGYLVKGNIRGNVLCDPSGSYRVRGSAFLPYNCP